MEYSYKQRFASTLARIVFPFYTDPKGLYYKYDTALYRSYLTGGRLSEDAVNKFVNELDIAANNFGSLKLWEGSTEKLIFRYILGIFIIIGGFLTKIDKEEILNTLFIWVCCCSGLIILVNSLVFLLVVIKQKSRSERKLFVKLQKVIEQQNKELQPLGLSWHLSLDHLRWIELELDTKYDQTESLNEDTVLFFELDFATSQYILHDKNHRQKQFNPELVDGRLSKTDLNNFLKSLSNIPQKYSHGGLNPTLVIGGLILLLEFFSFIYFRNQEPARILFVMVLISLFLFRSLYNKVVEKENSLVQTIKDEISQTIAANKNTFKKLGLRWHLAGDSFNNLDLWLDYKYAKRYNLEQVDAQDDFKQPADESSEILIDIDPNQKLLNS